MAQYRRSNIRVSVGWVIALACLLVFFISASIPKQGMVPLFACKAKTQTVPKQNLHLFILVDQSASAIDKDKTGEIRSVILHTMVEFAVGYGWLADAPPYLHIYKYSTAYMDKDNAELVYPTGVFDFLVNINDLKKTLQSIDVKLDITKVEPLAENLPATLTNIGQDIEKIPSGDKVLVFLITQGGLVESGSHITQTDALLAASNVTASLKAQTGVFMFEDDGLLDEWKAYFSPGKNAPEIYFHTCCKVKGPSEIVWDRKVWDGMVRIYREEELFNGYVSTGFIPTTATTDVFSSDTESLYAVSLKWPQEVIIVNDTPGTVVTNTLPNLLKFESDGLTEGSTWSPKLVSNVQILYTCQSSTTSVSPALISSTLTPNPTQTPQPVCPPDCPEPFKFLTPGGIISIVVAALLFWLFKDSPNFYINMAWIFFVADVAFIGYFLSSAVVGQIFENVFTDIFSKLITGLIYGGGIWIKKHEQSEVNPDRSKFEDIVVLKPAFFWAMLFAILSSTLINSLLH